MNWSERCAAVIPCYNEGETIGAVVRDVRCFLANVIVVDDGSNDVTAANAEAAGANVVKHAGNRGKGAAVASGLREALRNGFECAMLMDGDGQHAASDIPRFLECRNTTGAALIIGNRMHGPSAMPWLRRHVNQWMSQRLAERAKINLPDTQCGFRLVDLEVWSTLQLRAEHFEIESEMLMAFVRVGRRIEFVPIEVIYHQGRSKICPIVDTWRWFKWWLGVIRNP